MVSVILLSGGTGKRFGGEIPKQYLKIKDKPIFAYSLELFLSLDTVREIIIVADPFYHDLFAPYFGNKKIHFASPGKERKDSVASGFTHCSEESSLICIHDAARPFPPKHLIEQAFEAALDCGASALAEPITDTVKQISKEGYITSTIDRSTLLSMQTPQVIRRSLFEKALKKASADSSSITDDISMIEALGEKAKPILSPKSNLKITSALDLELATFLLERQ